MHHPDSTPQHKPKCAEPRSTSSEGETDDSSATFRDRSRILAKATQQLKALQAKHDELAASNRSYASQVNNNNAKLARKEEQIAKWKQDATDAKADVTKLKAEMKILNSKLSENKKDQDKAAKEQ